MIMCKTPILKFVVPLATKYYKILQEKFEKYKNNDESKLEQEAEN